MDRMEVVSEGVSPLGHQASGQQDSFSGHHGNPISLSNGRATVVRGSGVAMTTTTYSHTHHDTSPSSSSSSDSSSTEFSSSDESSDSETSILRQAGVTFDLASVYSVDGHAPLELVSQCVSCMMRNQYEAANLLCKKVLELEPENETAKEVYVAIHERLDLDKQLPTESSSSSSSEEEEGESSSASSDGDVK